MRKTRLLPQWTAWLLCAAVNVEAQGGQTAPSLPPTVPVSARVTLDQAVEFALAHNPLRLASYHIVASARNNLSSQQAFLNPTLQFSGINNTVAPISFGNLNNYVLYGVIETSGRKAIRTHQARAQWEGSVADSNTTALTVLQGVTTAYIALQSANLVLESEKSAYSDARRISELTEQQFKIGSAPETNAIQARIALEQEANSMRGVMGAVELARASLNQQMGLDPTTPVDAADPLEFKPVTLALDDLQALASLRRTEIQSAAATERALKQGVKMQRSQYYPDVTLGTTAQFDSLQMGIALPIFDFGSIRGAVRKAKEDVKAQQAQTLQVRQQVKLDVENACVTLKQAEEQVTRSRDQIVPRAQTLFTKIEQGYRIGGNTILDLLTAQATLRSARNDFNTARANYRQARAQLERAVGASAPW